MVVTLTQSPIVSHKYESLDCLKICISMTHQVLRGDPKIVQQRLMLLFVTDSQCRGISHECNPELRVPREKSVRTKPRV